MEAVMSALSSIEAPVAATDIRAAARSDVSGRQRPLRVIDGSAPASEVPATRGALRAAEPRSSSIPCPARHGSPDLSGPKQTGPIQTGPILTGTVVSGRRPRFGPASGVQASRARLRLTRRGRIVVTV